MSISEYNTSRTRLVVIGGGITGLAAAQRAAELNPDLEITLLEAAPRLGGVLKSERREGYLIEHGADNFITTVPWALDFCRRIGFEDQLISTNPRHRHAFVVQRDHLYKIPSGFVVMAPSRIWPIVTTPILSLAGKARLAMEPFLKRRHNEEDESLAAFARRRLGREVYERLVQPLVAGIYTADAERLSLQATFPRFQKMEREHGSLTRGMLTQRRQHGQTSASGARYGQFVAPRRGMSAFVDAIVQRLRRQQVAIRLNSPVQQMSCDDHSWTLRVGDHELETIKADGVILATPAGPSARLLGEMDARLGRDLGSIPYGSCAIVSLGYRRDQIGHALNGFGVVVPLAECRRILSASFSSVKYRGRAPADHVLLRLFIGGACQSDLLYMDNAHLLQIAHEEVGELLSIKGQPVMQQVVRRNQSMPQYNVGHVDLVDRITTRAGRLPNFAVASNALQGVGIPHCIHGGEVAADALVERLSKRAFAVAT